MGVKQNVKQTLPGLTTKHSPSMNSLLLLTVSIYSVAGMFFFSPKSPSSSSSTSTLTPSSTSSSSSSTLLSSFNIPALRDSVFGDAEKFEAFKKKREEESTMYANLVTYYTTIPKDKDTDSSSASSFVALGIRSNFKNHEPSSLKAAMLRIADVRKFVQENKGLNYKELQAEAGLHVFTRLTAFEDLEGTGELSEEQQKTIRNVIFSGSKLITSKVLIDVTLGAIKAGKTALAKSLASSFGSADYDQLVNSTPDSKYTEVLIQLLPKEMKEMAKNKQVWSRQATSFMTSTIVKTKGGKLAV